MESKVVPACSAGCFKSVPVAFKTKTGCRVSLIAVTYQTKQARFYPSYSAFTIQVTGKFKSAGKKQVVKELNIFAVGEKIIIGLLSNWARSPKELTLLWNMAKV